MADRTGDPVGAPLAGAQDETMTDRTGDHTGDRKGRPYRRVPRMRPMTDRKGDPVGAPLAGAPDDTAGKGL